MRVKARDDSLLTLVFDDNDKCCFYRGDKRIARSSADAETLTEMEKELRKHVFQGRPRINRDVRKWDSEPVFTQAEAVRKMAYGIMMRSQAIGRRCYIAREIWPVAAIYKAIIIDKDIKREFPAHFFVKSMPIGILNGQMRRLLRCALASELNRHHAKVFADKRVGGFDVETNTLRFKREYLPAGVFDWRQENGDWKRVRVGDCPAVRRPETVYVDADGKEYQHPAANVYSLQYGGCGVKDKVIVATRNIPDAFVQMLTDYDIMFAHNAGFDYEAILPMMAASSYNVFIAGDNGLELNGSFTEGEPCLIFREKMGNGKFYKADITVRNHLVWSDEKGWHAGKRALCYREVSAAELDKFSNASDFIKRDADGRLYAPEITVASKVITTCSLRDTAKILAGGLHSISNELANEEERKLFSDDVKMSFDYSIIRDENYDYTDELPYMEQDIHRLKPLIRFIIEEKLSKLTAKSNSVAHSRYEYFKRVLETDSIRKSHLGVMLGISARACESSWDNETVSIDALDDQECAAVIEALFAGNISFLFPPPPAALQQRLHAANSGGLISDLQARRRGTSAIARMAFEVDVNSSYPSIMADMPLPIGKPDSIDNPTCEKLEKHLSEGKLAIIAGIISFTLPPHVPPFVVAKVDAEYTRKRNIANVRLRATEGARVVITSAEWQALKAMGGRPSFKHIDGLYIYAATRYAFEHIEADFKRRAEAKSRGEVAMPYAMKILLNSLYGALGEQPRDETECSTIEGGVYARKTIKAARKSKGGHMAAAAFITAYGRIKLVAAITDVAKAWPKAQAVYTDTDSIFFAVPFAVPKTTKGYQRVMVACEAKMAKAGVKLGKALGEFSVEGLFCGFELYRAKTYRCKRIDANKDGTLTFKQLGVACGYSAGNAEEWNLEKQPDGSLGCIKGINPKMRRGEGGKSLHAQIEYLTACTDMQDIDGWLLAAIKFKCRKLQHMITRLYL